MLCYITTQQAIFRDWGCNHFSEKQVFLCIILCLTGTDLSVKIVVSVLFCYLLLIFTQCFPSILYERSWWRLFQKRIVGTKLDIYVLININFDHYGDVKVIKHICKIIHICKTFISSLLYDAIVSKILREPS